MAPLFDASRRPILIGLSPGTWSLDDPWWQSGLFVQELDRRGFMVVPLGWSTALEVVAPFPAWEVARDRTLVRLRDRPVDAWITHSHGGTVALMALADGGPTPRLLVTVAMPIRLDRTPIYLAAAERLRAAGAFHVNLRSDGSDLVQELGTVGDGGGLLERDLPWPAVNVLVPGLGHHAGAWFDPGLWSRNGWWEWLRALTVLPTPKLGTIL